MPINENQKKIAVLLMHEPKTADDLNKQLNIPFNILEEELRDMLKQGVVIKAGFPTKYSLKPEIIDRVKHRKEIETEDINKLRLKVIIEGQAIEEDLLKKQLKDIEASLKKQKDFTIYEVSLAKLVKSEEHFSSYLDVNLSVRDFRSLVKLLFFFGPSSIEVIKPKKIELTADELQDGLVEAAEMIQSYNNYILKLLNKKELAKFYSKLYEKKA